MKLLFVDDAGSHLGCLDMDGDTVLVKRYKEEFAPKIVDAFEENDEDETEGPYAEEGDDDDEDVKKLPKKFKGGGMFK